MAKTPAAEVEAGGRAVRVSSPDRVIYEATDRTPEVTKLMVAEYFASVEDGLMRALRDRPTALERWPSGVRPGMKLATGRADKDAEAFYQKRVPKGAPPPVAMIFTLPLTGTGAMPALADEAGAKLANAVSLSSTALADIAPVGSVRLPAPRYAGGLTPSLLKTAPWA